jgi:hypothetical protein
MIDHRLLEPVTKGNKLQAFHINDVIRLEDDSIDCRHIILGVLAGINRTYPVLGSLTPIGIPGAYCHTIHGR